MGLVRVHEGLPRGLHDSVVPGGFVVIDDYSTFSGCRKAVDQFFADREINVPLLVAAVVLAGFAANA